MTIQLHGELKDHSSLAETRPSQLPPLKMMQNRASSDMSALPAYSPGGSRPEYRTLHDAFDAAIASLGGRVEPMSYGKFGGQIKRMTTGAPVQAALGLHRFVGVTEAAVAPKLVDPVAAIEEEMNAHGTEDDKWCLEYVLRHAAGSTDREWPNGHMDEGRNGETFDDFVAHPHAQAAGLDAGHVLALRLYTTAAYKSLNNPLRDMARTAPHPFPVTILKLSDGIKKLRAVSAGLAGAHECADLFRGMRDMSVTPEFERAGGSELACMSTTTDSTRTRARLGRPAALTRVSHAWTGC